MSDLKLSELIYVGVKSVVIEVVEVKPVGVQSVEVKPVGVQSVEVKQCRSQIVGVILCRSKKRRNTGIIPSFFLSHFSFLGMNLLSHFININLEPCSCDQSEKAKQYATNAHKVLRHYPYLPLNNF